METEPPTNITEVQLSADSEQRIEVGQDQTINVVLKAGHAEIFGTELVRNKIYTFRGGSKFAVFTWHGCTLEISGQTEVSYESSETPMAVYLNLHAGLEVMREKAKQDGINGPTCMVVGSADSGKSTLCKILLNYAVRYDRRPVFVDLDLGQGHISIPRTIGAMGVQQTTDVEDGLFPIKCPLTYHFGHETPTTNLTLYNLIVSTMAQSLNARMEVNPLNRVSGTIINTGGFDKEMGYAMLVDAAVAFKVDVLVVLGQELLYNQLKRLLPSNINICLVPKSGGVVQQSDVADNRKRIIRQYFYGTTSQYHPHSFKLSFSDLKIFQVGKAKLPDSLMPIGTKDIDYSTSLVPVTPSPQLVYHLLSVPADDVEDNILTANVQGFICVTGVDMESKEITVLSPQPFPLPGNRFLLSDLQFEDSH